MTQNTVTVVDYNEPKDIFTIKTVTYTQVTGTQLNALVEARREFPHLLLTAEEQALTTIFEKHFDDTPHDMLNHEQPII